MNKMVSVVVPVYNVAQYLRKFIDSIFAQTYKDIELICVDDGSTDESVAILESYGEQIRIIRQHNQGAGVARNAGLAVAKGEYVYFCDPDDWCEPKLVELCVEKAESEKCDVVVFGRNIYDESQEKVVERKLLPPRVASFTTAFSPKDISDVIFSSFGQAPWNKFYRREYLEEKQLRFQDLPRNNDVYFTSASYVLAERIGVVNSILYNYRQNRPNSLQRDCDATPDTLFSVFEALESKMRVNGVFETYKIAFEILKITGHLSKIQMLRRTRVFSEYVRKLQQDDLFRVDGSFYPNRAFYLSSRLLTVYECTCLLKHDVVVSLTSFPARINTVDQTIVTLLNQRIKPSRIVLWLAKEQFPQREKGLPQQLLSLVEYGLKIKWCKDYRSYKKLIPSLEKYPTALIVTADDDILYSPTWLEKLVRAYYNWPNCINCHRVSQFIINKDGSFRALGGGRHFFQGASALNKICSGAGAIFPPQSLSKDVKNVNLALKLAPTNDDQWFWVHSVRVGFNAREIDEAECSLKLVDGSQDVALWKNNDRGENLFWSDFQNLCEQYLEFKKTLCSEWKLRAVEHNSNMQVYREQLEGWYLRAAHEVLCLDNPKTYNQKMQWLKLFDSTPIKTRLADKYLVREWVKARIGEKYLIPLLGVYNSFDEIDFEKLPDQFVIKGNHGCGYNLIVKDKTTLDKDEAKTKVDSWMKSNFGNRAAMELQYRDIKPKVVVEKFIENKASGGDLYDYKFWCFNGKVEYVQFLSDRNISGLKMAFYSRDWVKQPFVYSHPLDDKNMPRPDNLDEMIGLAEVLAKDFNHVRVDFYRLDDGTIYFGEMTFTSASGVCHWNVPGINDKLGSLLCLPDKAYNIDTGEYFDPLQTRPGLAHLEERCRAAWRLDVQYRNQLKRVADRDTWLANEKKKVADRDRRLEEQKLRVADRDRWLEEQKRRVADRDRWLKEQKRRVADRDRWLEEQKRRVADRDSCLKDTYKSNLALKKMIERFSDEVKSLKHSEAYRIGLVVTWPARLVYRMFKRRHERGLRKINHD